MGRTLNGVAVVTGLGGSILLYSGIRNIQPGDAIRQLLKRPNLARPIGPAFGDTTSGLAPYVAGAAAAGGAAAAAGAAGAVAAGVGGTGLTGAARSKLGAKYVFGATGPTTFDCSGLVVWALQQNGYKPPRFTTYTFGTWAKANGWTRINSALGLQAGDVVLKTGHMGIMTGPVTMIDAPHTGAVVRSEKLWPPLTQWWGWRPGSQELRNLG